jgi:hypothetical protein
MGEIILNRNQIYELIWSNSITKLAKEYNLSGSRMRSICKKLNIPLPYAGCWQSIKFGKSVRKVKLPTSLTGNEEVTFKTSEKSVEKKQNETADRINLIKEIVYNHKHLIAVPARLTNPDILIVKAKENMTDDRKYLNDGLIPTHSGFIKIKVAPDNIPRALRIMDTVLKLLKARGHELVLIQGEIYAVVFGEKIVIYLQEKLRYEFVLEDKDYWKSRSRICYPTGILTFRIWKSSPWYQKMWIDGSSLIESQIADITAGIELYAKMKIQEDLEIEENSRRRAEITRIENEPKERAKQDNAEYKKLLKDSKKWQQYQNLLVYIAEVENKTNLSGGSKDEFKEWLRWAREKAEKLNPLNRRNQQE